MRLTIGDLVRDHTDMALGTVVGLAKRTAGDQVAVYVSGDSVRLSDPYDLTVVSRYRKPTTSRGEVLAVVALIAAVVAAGFGCEAAYAAGAGWQVMFLSSLGAFTSVMAAYRCWVWLSGPRRFYV